MGRSGGEDVTALRPLARRGADFRGATRRPSSRGAPEKLRARWLLRRAFRGVQVLGRLRAAARPAGRRRCAARAAGSRRARLFPLGVSEARTCAARAMRVASAVAASMACAADTSRSTRLTCAWHLPQPLLRARRRGHCADAEAACSPRRPRVHRVTADNREAIGCSRLGRCAPRSQRTGIRRRRAGERLPGRAPGDVASPHFFPVLAPRALAAGPARRAGGADAPQLPVLCANAVPARRRPARSACRAGLERAAPRLLSRVARTDGVGARHRAPSPARHLGGRSLALHDAVRVRAPQAAPGRARARAHRGETESGRRSGAAVAARRGRRLRGAAVGREGGGPAARCLARAGRRAAHHRRQRTRGGAPARAGRRHPRRALPRRAGPRARAGGDRAAPSRWCRRAGTRWFRGGARGDGLRPAH